MLALFNEEQLMFENTAKRLAQSIGITNPHDLLVRDRNHGWQQITEVGLLSLRIRDNGLPLASGVEVMIAAQALGETLAPQPFVGSLLAGELLAMSDAPSDLIESAATGETRYALLLDNSLQGLASPEDHDCIAWDSQSAHYALGLRGHQLVRVDLQHGFAPAQEAADLTRELRCRQGGLSVEAVGTTLTQEQVMRWQALALTTVAADIVGVLHGAHAGAIAYTKERSQYGVLIGSFQAIQHLCAEMLVQAQAAYSITCYAAWAVDQLEPEQALLAARTAKAFAASAALPVTETVMQVYGGIGQTWEHIAHVYTRRALVGARLFGDEAYQLQQIADVRLGAR